MKQGSHFTEWIKNLKEISKVYFMACIKDAFSVEFASKCYNTPQLKIINTVPGYAIFYVSSTKTLSGMMN